MNIKFNPRWHRAPFEQTYVFDPNEHHRVMPPINAVMSAEKISAGGFEFIVDPYPYRFETLQDWEAFLKTKDTKLAVPWFLVEQPDGTWKESW